MQAAVGKYKRLMDAICVCDVTLNLSIERVTVYSCALTYFSAQDNRQQFNDNVFTGESKHCKLSPHVPRGWVATITLNNVILNFPMVLNRQCEYLILDYTQSPAEFQIKSFFRLNVFLSLLILAHSSRLKHSFYQPRNCFAYHLTQCFSCKSRRE